MHGKHGIRLVMVSLDANNIYSMKHHFSEYPKQLYIICIYSPTNNFVCDTGLLKEQVSPNSQAVYRWNDNSDCSELVETRRNVPCR